MTKERCRLHLLGQASLKGKRVAQEDAILAVDIPLPSGWQVFAVFDGHGGSEIASYAQRHLAGFLEDRLLSKCAPANVTDRQVQDAIVAFDACMFAHFSRRPSPTKIQEAVHATGTYNTSPRNTFTTGDDDDNDKVDWELDPPEDWLTALLCCGRSPDLCFPSSGQEEEDLLIQETKHASSVTDATSNTSINVVNDQQVKVRISPAFTSGSTMVLVLAHAQLPHVLICHLGDSPATVIDDRGKCTRLTVDHTSLVPDERIRLGHCSDRLGLKGIGELVDGDTGHLVGGPNSGLRLAVTRALGDFAFKRRLRCSCFLDDFPLDYSPTLGAVSTEPEVRRYVLQAGHYLLLASDGLWCADGMVEQDSLESAIGSIVTRHAPLPKDPVRSDLSIVHTRLGMGQAVCRTLVHLATGVYHSLDNVSVVLLAMASPQ